MPPPASVRVPVKVLPVESLPTPSVADVSGAEFSTVPLPESVFTSLSKPFMSSIAPLSTSMSDAGLKAYSAPAPSVPDATSVRPL